MGSLVFFGAAVQLRGARRALSPEFSAAAIAYAVLSLPNFRLPRSWTLSLSAAARRTTPAAGADSFFVKWMELGRWPRRLLRSYRVDVPPGRRCGCWPTSPFLFRGIRSRRSGRMMMMMIDDAAAAAPANDGARALDNNQLRGHRQQIGKSAALSVGRLTSLAQRCLRKDQQNLADLTTCVALTRAREADTPIQRRR